MEKFKLVKGQVLERNIAGEKLDEFFSPMNIKIGKKEPSSGGERFEKGRVYF